MPPSVSRKCFFITMIHILCIVYHVSAFPSPMICSAGESYLNQNQRSLAFLQRREGKMSYCSLPPSLSMLHMVKKGLPGDSNGRIGSSDADDEDTTSVVPVPSTPAPRTRRHLQRKRKLATIMLAITAGMTGRLIPFQASGPRIPTASANVQFNPLLGRELEKMQVSSNSALAGKLTPYQTASKIRTEREKARMEVYNKRLDEARNQGNEEAFQQQYKEEQEDEMKLEHSKRRAFYLQLLAMGINPSGIEGQKRVWKFEYNIDLSTIRGTDQERLLRMRGTPAGDALEKRTKRLEMIELESLMDNNVDLVEFYIQKNSYLNSPEMGAAINSELLFDDKLPRSKLLREISKMEHKFRQEGKDRTTPRRDYDAIFDQVDLEEKIVLREEKAITVDPKTKQSSPDKATEKEIKRQQKLKEQEERERIKAEKKAEKEKIKAQKVKEREQKNILKLAEKEAARKSVSEVEGKTVHKGTSIADIMPIASPDVEVQDLLLSEVESLKSNLEEPIEEDESSDDALFNTDASVEQHIVSSSDKFVGVSRRIQNYLPSIKLISRASGAIALLGGGMYSFNAYSRRAEEKKAEQQRKFDLIMGNDKVKSLSNDPPKVNGDSLGAATTRSTLEDLETLISGDTERITSSKEDSSTDSTAAAKIVNPLPTMDSTSLPAPAPPKKKRSMLGSIFKKESPNGREVSLERILSVEAYPQTAPYSQILSQYLTVGAPGRFPKLESKDLVPFVIDGEFQLETAKDNLIQTKMDFGITDEEAAESFANVVHAMIIQLVDLASSATDIGKTAEEKEKLTVDALNVVLDYMDHAASLFDAVAQVRYVYVSVGLNVFYVPFGFIESQQEMKTDIPFFINR